MNISSRKEAINALQLMICIILSFLFTFEILFLALPCPHMDVMRATQPVSAYYGQIDQEGIWHFMPTTIPTHSMCIVRRTLIVWQVDDADGRYIEVATDDNRLLYIKIDPFADDNALFPQNMDIVRFPVPPPWRGM